jgi:hypothetical protein
MMHPRPILTLAFASLAVLGPGIAVSQEPLPPQTVRPMELAAQLRAQAEEEGHLRGVLFGLIQVWGPYPDEEVDALADTLVAVALDFSWRGDDEGRRIGRIAPSILFSAAHWKDPTFGKPYPRAGERIAALALGLAGARGFVLLARLPDRAEGLAHLRDIATSSHPRAVAAVNVLMVAAGDEGLALLRTLYDEDLVKEPRANWELQAYASGRGWER